MQLLSSLLKMIMHKKADHMDVRVVSFYLEVEVSFQRPFLHLAFVDNSPASSVRQSTML